MRRSPTPFNLKVVNNEIVAPSQDERAEEISGGDSSTALQSISTTSHQQAPPPKRLPPQPLPKPIYNPSDYSKTHAFAKFTAADKATKPTRANPAASLSPESEGSDQGHQNSQNNTLEANSSGFNQSDATALGLETPTASKNERGRLEKRKRYVISFHIILDLFFL
jgi:hypothetical protein